MLLTDDAQTDLQELYDYIAGHDAPAKADAVLNKLDLKRWSHPSAVSPSGVP